jgi:hypothetical protein
LRTKQMIAPFCNFIVDLVFRNYEVSWGYIGRIYLKLAMIWNGFSKLCVELGIRRGHSKLWNAFSRPVGLTGTLKQIIALKCHFYRPV